MPTGIAIRDARAQLFDAAERVLLRAGPHALTSRAVTTEAGVAKGVLHRHFADFDAFLAELTLDRAARIDAEAAVLRAAAGTATVAGNLAVALTLIGTAHLLAVDGDSAQPDPEAVRKMVATVLDGVLKDRDTAV